MIFEEKKEISLGGWWDESIKVAQRWSHHLMIGYGIQFS